MAEDDALRRDLLWRIEARRASVQAYPPRHRPRTRRRATLTVVLSSLAALFTAGPAFGRRDVRRSRCRTASGWPATRYVWRTLCLLALLVSVARAILTNLGKAQDDVGRLSSAEAASAELEGLTSAPAVRPAVGGGRRRSSTSSTASRSRSSTTWPRRAPASGAATPRAPATTSRPGRPPATYAPPPPQASGHYRRRPRTADGRKGRDRPGPAPPAGQTDGGTIEAATSGARSQARCVPRAAISPAASFALAVLPVSTPGASGVDAGGGEHLHAVAPGADGLQVPERLLQQHDGPEVAVLRRAVGDDDRVELDRPGGGEGALDDLDVSRRLTSCRRAGRSPAAARPRPPAPCAASAIAGQVGAGPGDDADDPAGDRPRRRPDLATAPGDGATSVDAARGVGRRQPEPGGDLARRGRRRCWPAR